MPFFCFDGHLPSKQSLTSEGEDACIPSLGLGAWPRGQEREVTEDTAHFLRATRCFHEVFPAAPEVAPEPTTDTPAPDAGQPADSQE